MLRLLLPILLLGCSQNYSEKKVDEALKEKGLTPVAATSQKALAPSSYGSQEAGKRHSLGGLSTVLPEGWRQVPPSSSMRVAQFVLPGEENQTGEASLAIFYFGPNQGGGLEANIERWYGQFSQPDGGSTKERAKRREQEANGMPVTLVDIRGTYGGGMGGMGQSQEQLVDYRMLGAIVQAPKGAFFFKLTGPEETVERWAASFEQYIDGVLPE